LTENRNPNFFKASSNVSDPEVQAANQEDENDREAETEAREKAVSASPTKSLKFYKNEESKQLEHTPGFQDSNEKKSKETEKSVSKSKEKSNDKSKKSPKVIMKFNLSDEHDDVVVQNAFEDSQKKQRKHKFIEEFNDQDEYSNNDAFDLSKKVEETPENNETAEELEEQDYAAKDVVRSSLQRKYKAWDRADYKSKS
jgi:hypothetical protein